MLAPAISYITHLVDALAAALNVPLPHPLNPFEGSDPMVSAQHDLWARANVRSACYSLSPATHMNDRSRFLDFSWTSLLNLHPQPSSNVAHAPHAMMTHVDSKPNADTAAAKESSRKIEQEAEYVVNPNFPASLVLLQADVIALCMRAGIAPEDLYPPEAMLYNLHLLHKHCAAVVREQERRFDGTAGGLVSVVEVREPSTEVVDINPPSVEPLQTQNSVDLHSIVDRYGSAAAAREQQRLARQSGAVGGEHPTGLMEDSEDGVMIRSEFLATADTEWDMVHNVEF